MHRQLTGDFSPLLAWQFDTRQLPISYVFCCFTDQKLYNELQQFVVRTWGKCRQRGIEVTDKLPASGLVPGLESVLLDPAVLIGRRLPARDDAINCGATSCCFHASVNPRDWTVVFSFLPPGQVS